MKLLTTIFLFFSTIFLFAQDGGGEYIFEKSNCLTQLDRTEIIETLHRETEALKKAGKLPSPSKLTVELGWPVKAAPELKWASFYGISNFVDQNATTLIQDFNCTKRSYDGHNGLDIYTWPFDWYLYENDLVHVVASAPGTILTKRDGNFDQNCQWQGAGQWNAVYIRHDDGSVAWYGHMKKNSLTPKAVGERVERGEYLGVVASSGRSSRPHVHLELYDEATYNRDHLVDPYEGFCNNLNSESWWEEQKPYREPTLNTILTHSQKPEHGCPASNEIPYFENQFKPSDNIFFATYYHDQSPGDGSVHRLINPNGDIEEEWTRMNQGTYNSSWWFWTKKVPSGMPGIWTFEVDYFDQTLQHQFYICSSPIDDDGDGFCFDVDCDDSNADIHPEATDIPDNGIDENCDGIDVASSVSSILAENSVQIFPNPAVDFIKISNESELDLTVEIFNSLGQKMNSRTEVLKNNSKRVDVSDFERGIYFKRFFNNGEVVLVKRFVVF